MAKKAKKSVTPEQIRKIKTLRAAGKSYGAIAKQLGVGINSAFYYGSSVGKNKKPKALTPAIVAAPTRPMICLIGTPKDVCASVNELFS